MDLQEFLTMGGYAGYVWSAYGLTAVVLLLQLVGRPPQRGAGAVRARGAARPPNESNWRKTPMTPRQKRMATVAAILVGVGIATAFALKAFNQNLLYYYSPTQVDGGRGTGRAQHPRRRPGARTAACSASRAASRCASRSRTSRTRVGVSYTGVLPDLFREGQGVIARGKLGGDGMFVAEEVLAKHDENYMPPEVTDSLKPHTRGRAGHEPRPAAPERRPGQGRIAWSSNSGTSR